MLLASTSVVAKLVFQKILSYVISLPFRFSQKLLEFHLWVLDDFFFSHFCTSFVMRRLAMLRNLCVSCNVVHSLFMLAIITYPLQKS